MALDWQLNNKPTHPLTPSQEGELKGVGWGAFSGAEAMAWFGSIKIYKVKLKPGKSEDVIDGCVAKSCPEKKSPYGYLILKGSIQVFYRIQCLWPND